MIYKQNEKASQASLIDVTEFAIELQNILYPELFNLLNSVREKIDMLNSEMDNGLKHAIFNNLYTSLEVIFTKEKLVILPYIMKLEKEGKKLQNDSLIKNYNTLNSNIKLSIIDLEYTIENIELDYNWQLHLLHISQALKLFKDKLESTRQFRNNFLTNYIE